MQSGPWNPVPPRLVRDLFKSHSFDGIGKNGIGENGIGTNGIGTNGIIKHGGSKQTRVSLLIIGGLGKRTDTYV